jgi:hypothetical protein
MRAANRQLRPPAPATLLAADTYAPSRLRRPCVQPSASQATFAGHQYSGRAEGDAAESLEVGGGMRWTRDAAWARPPSPVKIRYAHPYAVDGLDAGAARVIGYSRVHH